MVSVNLQESALKVVGLVGSVRLLDGYRVLRTCLVGLQVAIMNHRVKSQKNRWFSPCSIMAADFESHLILPSEIMQ